MVYLFLLGRILLGGYFVMSGVNHFKHLHMLTGYAQSKGVPMPREAVLLTGLMMVLGGLGILLGVAVQVSILVLSIFLLVTTIQMHQFWKISDQMARMGEEINFKKNLALLGALLMLLAIPLPWAVSLVM
jgi:putative oxidoreductase